jgi:hypothetical protein
MALPTLQANPMCAQQNFDFGEPTGHVWVVGLGGNWASQEFPEITAMNNIARLAIQG